jgi:hypothetical protein
MELINSNNGTNIETINQNVGGISNNDVTIHYQQLPDEIKAIIADTKALYEKLLHEKDCQIQLLNTLLKSNKP